MLFVKMCNVKRSFLRILVVACLFLMLVSSDALSAPPTLTHLFPAGGQRGSKVVVTCTGTFNWPTRVWAPGVEAIPRNDSGKLEIAIPADLATDRVWIRLYNEEGASVAQPFLIGSLKEVEEVEPNDQTAVAQSIADPQITLNGTLKERDVDCFALKLEAGQTVIAALDANTRLGSPMDAIVQIVSPDGIVLAENHDDLHLDPRLAFTVRQAGTYVVRLFAFPSTPGTDIRFSGGPNFIYRLTMTTGPYVTHAIPLSVAIDQPGVVAVAGWNIPVETRLPVVPLGGGKLAEQDEFEIMDGMRRSHDARIGFAFSEAFAGATRVRLTPQIVVSAFAAAGAHSVGPRSIQVSSSVSGCLRIRRQVDDYRIPLTKGQQVLISVETSSLDLPLDPVLKLSDPSGTLIAEADDMGSSRDAFIAHTAAMDGEYRLSVRDRFGQGGDRCWYLLTIRNEELDFELSAGADTIVINPDKPAELTVKVKRSGPKNESIGPIAIEAVGLPPGVKSAAVTSEATGATAAEVKLSLTTEGPAFSGPIRIQGKASQPKEVTRFARTPAKLGVAFEAIWLTAIAKP